MAIMDNHAEYIDRPGEIEIFGRLPRHHHRVDNAVTISPGRNFNDFHFITCFLPSVNVKDVVRSIIPYPGTLIPAEQQREQAAR
ncbi:hypothetical protein D3C71_1578060 [compost metagenome]